MRANIRSGRMSAQLNAHIIFNEVQINQLKLTAVNGIIVIADQRGN
jgi:hypothetical protein